MNLIRLGMVFFLTCFWVANSHAAGSPVNEDFSLVIELSDNMIAMAKAGNKEGFVELADSALKLSEAQRRDNSMAIDRFRPKLRAAKKAGKAGDFDNAIKLIEEAKLLMHPSPALWDGSTTPDMWDGGS
ncbi:hypothetical protein [Crenothrix polyspora]|uniref:Uncharacterized protein n=1 Tax=Crenothrix polyspora TaxID=360316 RepID=A0A1R4HED7_9GAMM|nr:hypothetical protein [Crenothrix polyspora]SJM94605.1 conserved exported hypothetical protein [Crenothrix polyspora]